MTSGILENQNTRRLHFRDVDDTTCLNFEPKNAYDNANFNLALYSGTGYAIMKNKDNLNPKLWMAFVEIEQTRLKLWDMNTQYFKPGNLFNRAVFANY